jgi:hypothetical protein
MLVGVSDGHSAEVAEGLPTLALHLVAALLFVESWTTVQQLKTRELVAISSSFRIQVSLAGPAFHLDVDPDKTIQFDADPDLTFSGGSGSSSKQCCGSGMFIPDSGSECFHPGPDPTSKWFRIPDPVPHQRIKYI